MDDPNLIPTHQAAVILGVQDQTMRKWRLAGKGPESVKIGPHRFYNKNEVNAYANSRAALTGHINCV